MRLTRRYIVPPSRTVVADVAIFRATNLRREIAAAVRLVTDVTSNAAIAERISSNSEDAAAPSTMRGVI
jgi:hypothetical protein